MSRHRLRPSVLTMHRRIVKDATRNFDRALDGRYVWDPQIRRAFESAKVRYAELTAQEEANAIA